MTLPSLRSVVGPLLAATLLSSGPAAADPGWKEVPVTVRVPPTLDTIPEQKVLVARMRASDHPRLDIGLEISRWVRREIARGTALDTIDVTPPQIPEQLPDQLAVNDVFWRRLGEDFEADLIVAGIANLIVEDRSGYVTEDGISPVTGQTVRRSVFREMRGFKLVFEVFFFKGDNGALLHRDTWRQEWVMGEDRIRDDLTMLYALLESVEPELMSIFVPTTLKQPRFIWVD